MSSFPTLETINNDCLIEIFQYLNFAEIINMVETCSRLLNFAKTEFFPRKAKKIIILLNATNYQIQAPLIDNLTTEFTLDSLQTVLGYFGEFVKDLTCDVLHKSTYSPFPRGFWKNCVIVMECCKELKILKFSCGGWSMGRHIRAFRKQVERFENFIELDLLKCNEIVKKWPPALKSKSISKVNKISFRIGEEINPHFIEYFSNVSSLTIDVSKSSWRFCEADEIAKILNANNGRCLKDLTLTIFRQEGYQSIATIITENFPTLESLSLDIYKNPIPMFLITLPHLKSLNIKCYGQNINPLLRTLSDGGSIEELTLSAGFYDAEEEPPLIFNNLRDFSWRFYGVRNIELWGTVNFLKTMTKSQIPAIQAFTVDSYEQPFPESDVLKFIQSKETLKSITILGMQNFGFDFLRRVIDIMKTPCRQPIFKLSLRVLPLTEEQVSKPICQILNLII